MTWILLGLGAAFFAALVTIFGKIGLKHVDPTLATTIRVVIMTVFFTVISFSFGKFKTLSTIDNKALLYIALSAIAGGLSWLCYFAALKIGPAGAVAALDRVSIVLIVILGAVFLAEAITWKTGLGALLIALGTLLFVIK